MKSPFLVLPLLTLLLGGGCGGSTLLVGSDPDAGYAGSGADSGTIAESGSADSGSTGCTTDADCSGWSPGADVHCGFKVADACGAKGVCLGATTQPCTPLGISCACDGTDLNVDCATLPQGYATKPVAHVGACGDGGSGDDSGALACIVDSDCVAGSSCNYAIAAGCAAQGQCLPTTGLCNGIELGCACDGTSFNTICGGQQNGYVSKPLASAGSCTDAGTFACGNVTCTLSEYCTDTPPGVAPVDGGSFPDFYQCVALPAACLTNPTCTCIEGTISAQTSCSTATPGATCSGVGEVTIRCLGA